MSLRSVDLLFMAALHVNGAVAVDRASLRQTLASVAAIDSGVLVSDRRHVHAILARNCQRNHQSGQGARYRAPGVPRRKRPGYWEARALRELHRCGGNG